MIDAIDAIDGFLTEVSEKEFSVDALRQGAVVQKMIVIGEAAKRISPELKLLYADIPWRDPADFRNVMVHEYFGIAYDRVWATAKEDLAGFRKMLQKLFDTEFPSAG